MSKEEKIQKQVEKERLLFLHNKIYGSDNNEGYIALIEYFHATARYFKNPQLRAKGFDMVEAESNLEPYLEEYFSLKNKLENE